MHKVIIPRENVSDNAYKIISIQRKNNDWVNKNDMIAEIESSKAIVEVYAEEAGYFFSDRKEGEMIEVGEVIAFLQPEKFEDLKKLTTFSKEKAVAAESGITISKKAQDLIKSNNIVIDDLLATAANKEVISERDVLKFLDAKLVEDDGADLAARYLAYSQRKLKRIAIVGAGTSAIQIIDLMLSSEESYPTCIFDDTPHKLQKKLLGVPVIGKIAFDEIEKFFKESLFDEVIIGIPTSISFRSKVFDELKKRKVPIANLVHKSVYVGLHVQFGEGNVILPHSHIGSCTKIGNNNFITAKCSIEHNNVVGDHCTFGPGVMFSGNVTVGSKVKFGTGIFVEPNIRIGDNAIISSGSIITKNIEANTTVLNARTQKLRYDGTS